MSAESFRAAAFDYNGTLLSDASHFYEGVKGIFRHYGKTPPTFEEYREEITTDPIGFYQRRGIIASLEELNAFIRSHVYRRRPPPLAPGARRVLRELRRRGIPCALITGLQASILETELKRHRLGRAFAFVRADCREKTQALREAREAFSRGPGDLVFVTDAAKDIREAQEAGCFTIGYAKGYGSVASLSRAEPDLLLDDWRDFFGKLGDIGEFGP